MSEEPSNQLDQIQRATLWLRDKDKVASRPLRQSKYQTPWDIDWMRLRQRENNLPMPFQVNGIDILLTPHRRVEVPTGEIAIDFADYMVFQFLDPKDLDRIIQVYRVFGKLGLTKSPSRELDSILKYCHAMDENILEAVNKLKDGKCTGIFDKLWRQMGGSEIREIDRLGKRIEYYKEIVSRYKADSKMYECEIKELKLL